MTKVGLISDTHGFLHPRVEHHFKDCDEIWHAGDIGDIQVIDQLNKIAPTKVVYGNIDNHKTRTEYPEFDHFQCEGLKILMTHIGGYPGKYTKKAIELIKKYNPDIFICGHSHILKVLKDEKFNLIHINPGAIGKHGFHHVRTMIMLEVERKKILNMNVVEFKR